MFCLLAETIEERTISLYLLFDLSLIEFAHGEEILHKLADQLPKALLDRVVHPLQRVDLVAELMPMERGQHQKLLLQLSQIHCLHRKQHRLHRLER